MRPEDVRELFAAETDLTYLDSATYGLPPKPTIAALESALARWRSGSADWLEWEEEAEQSRELFAKLVGAFRTEIALMPAVSVATALALSVVPEGGEVLVAQGDFRSVVFPALVLSRSNRAAVREVPFGDIANAVGKHTSLVAVSHVHSADGSVADVAAIREATRSAGASLFLDATQSLGVLATDVHALDVDFLACAAYKWLCSPRGVAFLYVNPRLWDAVIPLTASWRGALGAPASGYYGGPLELQPDARRFDISGAWHSWVGARCSLEVLVSLGDEARWQMASEPARSFARLLALREPGSSIVSVPVSDGEAAEIALREAKVKTSGRAGRIRVSSHIYNTVSDAERAADVLAPFVAYE